MDTREFLDRRNFVQQPSMADLIANLATLKYLVLNQNDLSEISNFSLVFHDAKKNKLLTTATILILLRAYFSADKRLLDFNFFNKHYSKHISDYLHQVYYQKLYHDEPEITSITKQSPLEVKVKWDADLIKIGLVGSLCYAAMNDSIRLIQRSLSTDKDLTNSDLDFKVKSKKLQLESDLEQLKNNIAIKDESLALNQIKLHIAQNIDMEYLLSPSFRKEDFVKFADISQDMMDSFQQRFCDIHRYFSSHNSPLPLRRLNLL